MSMLTWLRGIATKTGSDVTRFPDPSSSAPLSPRLEQERRIWLRAALYRQQRAERLKAQAEQEARQERERIQRAQDEFEDACARSLAEGFSHFPHDRDGVPGPQVRPFDGTEDGGPFYGFVRW